MVTGINTCKVQKLTQGDSLISCDSELHAKMEAKNSYTLAHSKWRQCNAEIKAK